MYENKLFVIVIVIVIVITWAPVRVIIKVSGHQYWWLAGGYD